MRLLELTKSRVDPKSEPLPDPEPVLYPELVPEPELVLDSEPAPLFSLNDLGPSGANSGSRACSESGACS
jgi:hypothetical protein